MSAGDERDDEGERRGTKRRRLRFMHANALASVERADGARLMKKIQDYGEILERFKKTKGETEEEATRHRFNDRLGDKDRLEVMRREFEGLSDELGISAAYCLERAVAAELKNEALIRENARLQSAFPTAEKFGEMGRDVALLKSALADYMRTSERINADDRVRLAGLMHRNEALRAAVETFSVKSEALTERVQGRVNAAGARGIHGAGGTALDAAQVSCIPFFSPPSFFSLLSPVFFFSQAALEATKNLVASLSTTMHAALTSSQLYSSTREEEDARHRGWLEKMTQTTKALSRGIAHTWAMWFQPGNSMATAPEKAGACMLSLSGIPDAAKECIEKFQTKLERRLQNLLDLNKVPLHRGGPRPEVVTRSALSAADDPYNVGTVYDPYLNTNTDDDPWRPFRPRTVHFQDSSVGPILASHPKDTLGFIAVLFRVHRHLMSCSTLGGRETLAVEELGHHHTTSEANADDDASGSTQVHTQ